MSALYGEEWSTSQPACFNPWERCPITLQIWRRVDTRASHYIWETKESLDMYCCNNWNLTPGRWFMVSASDSPLTALSAPITEILLSTKVFSAAYPDATFRILFISILSLGSRNESFSINCEQKSYVYLTTTKHGQFQPHIANTLPMSIHSFTVYLWLFAVRQMMAIRNELINLINQATNQLTVWD